ncbi:MAG TPA: hypothetical protein VHF50_00600, partial [Solirubrobacterales bacterium]|nr:hypothetical protein [Solirubrobacterales bacterium]
NTGNTQKWNGNAYAKSEPQQQQPFSKGQHDSCGCDGYGKGRRHSNDADAEGGDTKARSGDATGGDGGDADADGGDAEAANRAKVLQLNESGVSESLW